MVAAKKLELEKLQSLQAEMEKLVAKYHHLKEVDPTLISVGCPDSTDPIIFPVPPSYFKISKLKGIDGSKIILEIEPKFVATCICGDGCAVNIKGSRLLETKFGIKSTFSRCSSHTAAGTIRHLFTSETMSQMMQRCYMKT